MFVFCDTDAYVQLLCILHVICKRSFCKYYCLEIASRNKLPYFGKNHTLKNDDNNKEKGLSSFAPF